MAAPSLTVPPFTPPSYVVGPAGQTLFPFSFPFWDPADIVVRINGAVVDPKYVQVDGYTTQAGAQVSGGFGSGVVTIGAVPVGATVQIDRFVQASRESVYGAGVPLPVLALNADFNRLIAMIQDVQRQLALLAATQQSAAAIVAELSGQTLITG